jgi:hypothetical protein
MSLLWTIMPIEVVLGDSAFAPVFEDIEYDGIWLQVERISPVQSRIVRLLTTNPTDYLEPTLQPGSLLSYRPGP